MQKGRSYSGSNSAAGGSEEGKDPAQPQRRYEPQATEDSRQVLRRPSLSRPSGSHYMPRRVTILENQGIFPSSREYWRDSTSSTVADTGPSPRTSTSSQTPSSYPMLRTTSPEPITSHSPTRQLSHGSSSQPRPRLLIQDGFDANPSPLNPPSAPFAQDSSRSSSRTGSNYSQGRHSPGSVIPLLGTSMSSRTIHPSASSEAAGLPSAASNASLSINYLPSKFSSGLVSSEAREGSARRRRGGGIKGGKGMDIGDIRIPKIGGGREAFRAGESRMAGEQDEDEDEEFRREENGGSQHSRWEFWRRSKTTKTLSNTMPRKTMRWNRFKWILFICNTLLSICSAVSLVVCLLTWFDAWAKADIVRVGNTVELSFSTVAAALGLFTSLIGWAGLLMNNRMFLAIYTFLCWITFGFLVVPGYLTYKKRTYNLEGKINAQWSRALGAEGRLRIQDQLDCCGYFNPFVEATVSQTCYARSQLPGCKGPYMDFEDMVLKKWYTAVFSLVPVHILIMTAGLLCSNHVTYRFGKGMMPKAYRLSVASMAIIMDQYAQHLAEVYGPEVATDVITRSKSQTQLDYVPRLVYGEDSLSSAGTSVTNVKMMSAPPF